MPVAVRNPSLLAVPFPIVSTPARVVGGGGCRRGDAVQDAHGAGFYGYVGRDLQFGALFSEAMGADSRVVAYVVVRECGEVFAGGDGTMTMAKAM